MKKRKEISPRSGYILPGVVFLLIFCFFLTLYPYHLLRREQLNLFVYDWDYIALNFKGIGWLSRLAGSFVDQFLCSRVLGPLFVALLLTAIATVVYRICCRFAGGRISILIAALVLIWSFLRECGNLYLTRYTIATLGFLCLILLALQFKTVLVKALSAILLLGLGAWALGAPYDSVYGKLWTVPTMESERLFGLDTEVAAGNWEKVLDLSEKDLYTPEASNCFDLAMAMTGQLGNNLFNHSQVGDPYYFLPFVSGEQNIYYNCLVGELWYRLGDMTIAEQSAITCLQASPEHTGARFIERLARINIITGQKAAAQKYLNLLSKTLFYRKWAERMLDGDLTAEDQTWIDRGRENMVSSDCIHLANDSHAVLLGLLEANPDNTPAREFLLCDDLLRYDLKQFFEDYDVCRLDARIYKEALIIWLGQNNVTSQKVIDEYGIDDSYRKRNEMFFRYPDNYRNTYWYYYLKAINESGQR